MAVSINGRATIAMARLQAVSAALVDVIVFWRIPVVG